MCNYQGSHNRGPFFILYHFTPGWNDKLNQAIDKQGMLQIPEQFDLFVVDKQFLFVLQFF
jgi:hypothetical protein